MSFLQALLHFCLSLFFYNMFGHGAFMSLTIEHCLSITFAFYLYFVFLNSLNRNFYILLAILPITILMKENFIFLIPIVCFLAVMGLVREKRLVNYFSYKNKYIYVYFFSYSLFNFFIFKLPIKF